ncbi:5-carboxymethyl-2-hydroxymuconate isomerase [Oceanicola sp. 22II-s10i]|uniref:fumarylacetoacetate hydrolase family protein n=1 Tax=Oceanicola sp. 22II-s10i TaxID=1317116 RepID=UPI000B522A5E|nr:fumarylacetoacetate hydrolase family protein [Oceanicola sp. 22II-s10i]OWU83150.1 5-carboxymethyl-2-hydroxymuconate isomerase [Oceanicola sp. 22II-s10i]
MRLISFLHAGDAGYGAISDDVVHRLDSTAGAPVDLRAWLALPRHRQQMPADAETLPLAGLHLLPPIPRPGKIFCIATNFHEPARQGKPDPEYPLIFMRIAEAQVGHGQPILKPSVSEKFDFEGELAVVIGLPGHKISRVDAMRHVAGFACFNDGSVRDWQKHSTQFTPGKNFARSGAFGPSLVTVDEVPDPSALRLETRVNGVVKQAIRMADMIFDIPWLISYISTFAPLQTGDVIATGTPSGFGSTRTPPEFLNAGDLVEIEIPGVGLLANPVAQDSDATGFFS